MSFKQVVVTGSDVMLVVMLAVDRRGKRTGVETGNPSETESCVHTLGTSPTEAEGDVLQISR